MRPNDGAVARGFRPALSVESVQRKLKGRPPLAIAPFTPEEAKRHQQAWADYLDVPVEQENSIGMRLRFIPPGEFLMGSSEEEIARVARGQKKAWIGPQTPQHRVRVTRSFYVGVHEVTVGQFRAFVKATDYRTEAETNGKGGVSFTKDKGSRWVRKPECTWRACGFEQTDQHPVVQLSWNDCLAFCDWLCKAEGEQYVLPTEAQWEFACRAGTTSDYWFSNDPQQLQGIANVADASFAGSVSPRDDLDIDFDDGYAFTSPAMRFRANPFGLHDVCGNAWEWCSDWFSDQYYAASPPADPAGPTSGTARVLRGGSFNQCPAEGYRSSRRIRRAPDFCYADTGFRVVLAIGSLDESESAPAAREAGSARGGESARAAATPRHHPATGQDLRRRPLAGGVGR